MEMKPRNVKGKFKKQVGGKGMDRVKGYKKRFIIILLTVQHRVPLLVPL